MFFLKTEVPLNFAFNNKNKLIAQIQKTIKEYTKGEDLETFGLAIIYFDFRGIHFYQSQS